MARFAMAFRNVLYDVRLPGLPTMLWIIGWSLLSAYFGTRFFVRRADRFAGDDVSTPPVDVVEHGGGHDLDDVVARRARRHGASPDSCCFDGVGIAVGDVALSVLLDAMAAPMAATASPCQRCARHDEVHGRSMIASPTGSLARLRRPPILRDLRARLCSA